MKIFVRHGDGELMFPSFRDFQTMYRLKFVGPDDLVRRENSDRWIPARNLPELRAIHLYDRDGTRPWIKAALWLMLAAFAVAVLLQLVLAPRGRTFDDPPSAPKTGAKLR